MRVTSAVEVCLISNSSLSGGALPVTEVMLFLSIFYPCKEPWVLFQILIVKGKSIHVLALLVVKP